jgi:DNA ligase-1
VLDTETPFAQRSSWLESNVPANGILKLVMTQRIDTPEEMDRLYEGFLAAGYEGQMVRVNAPYEQKRSKTLLKRKTFQDAEYRILEVGEGTGNRTGMAGFMVLENKDGSTFRSNIKGSHDFLTELWKNREEIKGEMGTCQFFNLTPDGVPRFPYVTSIRNYE